MKNLKVLKARLSQIAAGSAVVIATAGTAHADLPAGVTGAFTTATADAATLGGLAVVAIVAGVVFKYLRRAV